jgi:hypothetical protein
MDNLTTKRFSRLFVKTGTEFDGWDNEPLPDSANKEEDEKEEENGKLENGRNHLFRKLFIHVIQDDAMEPPEFGEFGDHPSRGQESHFDLVPLYQLA